MGINCLFNRVPLLDWEGVISEKGLFLMQTASVERLGWGSPINAKSQGRICSVCFKEIKFLINFTGEVEVQDWMAMFSVSCCASLLASLEVISSIHHEPAERMDKCFLMSDSSHCSVTAKRKHLKFILCCCWCYTLANSEDDSAVPTNSWQKKPDKANSFENDSLWSSSTMSRYHTQAETEMNML